VSLIERARKDVARILQNTNEFASTVKLTSPAGVTRDVAAVTNEVWQGLDPNSGNIVNGAVASIAISLDALSKAGLGIPQNSRDTKAKPWLVEMTLADGAPRTYTVEESRRDMGLGVIWYVLGEYQKQ
jgi:hypothetical protein